MAATVKTYEHDPSADLDYPMNWDPWLLPDENIELSEWSITPEGPSVHNKVILPGARKTSCFVTGIEDDTDYVLSNYIETDNEPPRKEQRSITIRGVQR
jgi:hypothetical protein